MKTLKTIQTISKIGKIISKIIFICCIVGAAGCLTGTLALAVTQNSTNFGMLTIEGIVDENFGSVDLHTIYAAMITGAVVCAGEAVLAKFASLYFTRELDAGTPFTFEGAKELTRLGIITICVSCASSFTVWIVSEIFDAASDTLSLTGSSVGLGLAFIVIALLCRLGAENAASNGEDDITIS